MGLIPNKFWNILKGRAKTSGNIGGIVSVATKQGVISNVRCGTKITQGDQVSLFRTDGRIWYAISLSPQTQRIRKETHFLGKVQSKRMILDDNFASYPFKIIAVDTDRIVTQGGDMTLLVNPDLNINDMDLEIGKVFIALIKRDFKDQVNNEYNYKAYLTSLKINGDENSGYIKWIDSTSKDVNTSFSLPITTYKEMAESAIKTSNYEYFDLLVYKLGTKIIFTGKELITKEYTLQYNNPSHTFTLEVEKTNEDVVTKDISEIQNNTTIGTFTQTFPYNLRDQYTLIQGDDISVYTLGYAWKVYRVFPTGQTDPYHLSGNGYPPENIINGAANIVEEEYPYFDYSNTVGLLPVPPGPFSWSVLVLELPYQQTLKTKKITKIKFGGIEVSNPSGIRNTEGLYAIQWVNIGYSDIVENVVVRNTEIPLPVDREETISQTNLRGGIWERLLFNAEEEIPVYGNISRPGVHDYIVTLGSFRGFFGVPYNIQKIKKRIDGNIDVDEETEEVGSYVSGNVNNQIVGGYSAQFGCEWYYGSLRLNIQYFSFLTLGENGNYSIDLRIFLPNYKPFEVWSLAGKNYGIDKSLTHSMLVDVSYNYDISSPQGINGVIAEVADSDRLNNYVPLMFIGQNIPEEYPIIETFFPFTARVLGQPNTSSLSHDVLISINSEDIIQLNEEIDYSIDIFYQSLCSGEYATQTQTTTTVASYSVTGSSSYKLNNIELDLSDSLYRKVSILSGTLPENSNEPTTIVFKTEDDVFRKGINSNGSYSLELALQEVNDHNCPTDFDTGSANIATISFPNTFNIENQTVIYSTATKSYTGSISLVTLKKKPFSFHIGDRPPVRDKGTVNERYAYQVKPRKYTFPNELDYDIDTITVEIDTVNSLPCANYDYLFTPQNCNTIVCFDPDYFLNRMSSDGMNLYRENRDGNPRLLFTQSRRVQDEPSYSPNKELDWFVDIFYFDELNYKFVYDKSVTFPVTPSVGTELFLADISYYAEPTTPADPLP